MEDSYEKSRNLAIEVLDLLERNDADFASSLAALEMVKNAILNTIASDAQKE